MDPSQRAKRLDVGTGLLQWVNAGHPHPLLLRDRRVVRTLHSPTTLPAGIGGATPHVSEESLEPGDRVLFFSDGITEEHTTTGGEQFGEPRLIDQFERRTERRTRPRDGATALPRPDARARRSDQRRRHPVPPRVAHPADHLASLSTPSGRRLRATRN